MAGECYAALRAERMLDEHAISYHAWIVGQDESAGFWKPDVGEMQMIVTRIKKRLAAIQLGLCVLSAIRAGARWMCLRSITTMRGQARIYARLS